MATLGENDAIAQARNLPELVANLKATGSPLASQIEGKSLLASKTPLAIALSGLLAYLAAKYGLGWSDDFDKEIAGGIIVLAGYLMRMVSPAPITSILPAASGTTPSGS